MHASKTLTTLESFLQGQSTSLYKQHVIYDYHQSQTNFCHTHGAHYLLHTATGCCVVTGPARPIMPG